MKSGLKPDWNPQSGNVLRDQHAVYDDMRKRCPVAYSEYMRWSLFRHEDVVRTPPGANGIKGRYGRAA